MTKALGYLVIGADKTGPKSSKEKAAEKVYSQLGRLQKMKRERAKSGRELMVGVAGCVAQAEGSEIIRRAPVVDLVVGPQRTFFTMELIDGESLKAVVKKNKVLPGLRLPSR